MILTLNIVEIVGNSASERSYQVGDSYREAYSLPESLGHAWGFMLTGA